MGRTGLRSRYAVLLALVRQPRVRASGGLAHVPRESLEEPMLRAACLAFVVVVSACGAYGNDPSAPGRPNACRDEGKACGTSAQCCSMWCVNSACERQMAERGPGPGREAKGVE
jgi:hypothetical protein